MGHGHFSPSNWTKKMNSDQNEENAGTGFESFFLEETSVVEIELPNGEPMLYPPGSGNRVKVRVYGPTSDEFVKASDAQQRFIAANVQVRRSGNVKNTVDPKEAREQDAKFLAAITSQVENFPFPGGAIAMYRNKGLQYIADQVRAHVNDQANFFARKPTA